MEGGANFSSYTLTECIEEIERRESLAREDAADVDAMYVLVAEERWKADGKVGRRYGAQQWGALYTWAAAPIQSRYYHEVIWRECKPYFEIDAATSEFAPSEVAAMADAFTAHVASRLVAHFNVVVDVVELDGSRASKFSRHVRFTCTDRESGEPVVFGSTAACGAFMEYVGREAGYDTALGGEWLFDRAVYDKNHTLRMYGSGKLKDASPQLLPAGAATGGALNAAIMARACVSGPFPPGTDIFEVPTIASRALKRVRIGMPRHKESADVVVLKRDIDELRHHDIRTAVTLPSGTIVIRTATTQCPFVGRAHSSNTLYFMVDPSTRTYRIGCYSPHCKGKKKGPFAYGPEKQVWARATCYALLA